MFKATPNPPGSGTDSPEALDAIKMKEAADRAFAHYFPPAEEKRSKRRKYQLFAVASNLDDPEALLANASEDLLSISAIAAGLADDVDGTRRSLALGISRLTDGVQLLVERVLDHHEALAAGKV
ncbi:DUF6124 family protein [Pseudomonas frederiksbergensis]|uniref:DUF3077 domain-containing protein n=1 Tax=Pseudomonas frederiksbergensis TaxID=104087 RepID=A0A423KPT0_9PSED|nr:DUF6124 family protein [Pseudomonas frederiksbergensis]RON56627.1 hypothetical protein BK665_06870 [Pseudomonas frederiksbergensis]